MSNFKNQPNPALEDTIQNPWLNIIKTEDGNQFAECDEENILEIANKTKGSGKIILNLPPQPFEGNIARSKIVFLHLNPGFKKEDINEQNDETFLSQTKKSMLQDDDAYFFSLMKEEFEGQSHYNWWNKRIFVKCDKAIRNDVFGHNYNEEYRKLALEYFSAVELFPYHSKDASQINTTDMYSLPSQKYSFLLVKKAVEAGKIVVMRSSDKWLNCPFLKYTFEKYPNNLYEFASRSTSFSLNNLKKVNGNKIEKECFKKILESLKD